MIGFLMYGGSYLIRVVFRLHCKCINIFFSCVFFLVPQTKFYACQTEMGPYIKFALSQNDEMWKENNKPGRGKNVIKKTEKTKKKSILLYLNL